MVEKVAEIEVELAINDREYTGATKRVTDATDKLDKKTKDLGTDIQKTGEKAKTTGKNFDEMGKHAERAGNQFSRLNTTVSRFQNMLGTFAGGSLLGGGIAGLAIGGLGMLAGAADPHADAMRSIGLAAGGDPTMFAAIDRLYRETNRQTTLESPKVGDIATQVAKRFDFLSPTEQTQFASQIATLGETGEDTGLILRSMEKVMKTYGIKNASETLNRMNYAANRSSNTVGETIASIAALSPESAKQGVSLEDLQKFIVSGSQIYGDTAADTASRVGRGLMRSQGEPQTPYDRKIRQSYPQAEWIWRMEYPTAWRPENIESLPVDTGRYLTETDKWRHGRDMLFKTAGEGFGDTVDGILSMFTQMAGDLITGNYQHPRPMDPTDYYAELRTQQPVINQTFNFSGNFTPSVDGVHLAQTEAAKLARR